MDTSFEVHEDDPRAGIESRQTLKNILQSLVPPPNFRVTLEVDKHTENLVLKVMKREPTCYSVFGKIFWRTFTSWEDPTNLLRVMTAKTYDGLLLQLKDRPEFLEFEFVIEGSVQYTTVGA